MTFRFPVRAAVFAAACALHFQPAGAQAVDLHAWGSLGAAPSLAAGQSISASQSLLKSNYGDNPSLLNSAWAHAGGTPWYAFQVLSTGDVTIDLTPDDAAAVFNPAITVWATGPSIFNGGSDDIEVGTNNGWGAPHSFNAVGQVGDAGTLWASGANGNLQQTLVYALAGPSHTTPSGNGWGEVINTGVNDISTDNSFESGISGSINPSGNSIHLAFSALKAGWYLAFIGGSNNALSAANYTLTVAAVPEPSTYLMTLGGLLAISAVAARRRG